MNTQLAHVTCEDHYDKLGQCDRYEGLCADGPVTVYCVGMFSNTPVSCDILPTFLYVQKYLPELYRVVFQEASGSTPQEYVEDRFKLIIEISGRMFA